ncbi:F-box associated interaction domain-containing protein [Artemisia annua]|uniref:F-box associated interaction domain-containing protein n=1 Tax=Artemisia annua TaxID=35608 RepID=A0A2U1QF23_ARTAN|nr:F-box associated interaction domain-containing protein [Artemisia annua]
MVLEDEQQQSKRKRISHLSIPSRLLLPEIIVEILYGHPRLIFRVSHKQLSHKDFRFMLIGSCNGFFCIVDKDTLTIDNPSTRIHKRLPFSGFRFADYAFGYDDSTDDYKVVSVSLDNKAKIYSLKAGSWKHINDVPHISPWCHRGTFSNGAFHWMVRICKESMSSYQLTNIVSLDLATETFGEVSPPVYDDEFDRSCTGVYGMKDSWTKLVSIPYFTNVGVYRVPLSMSNDGKFLLTFYKKLVVYDSMNCSFNEIHDFDADFEARILVESLVSPYGRP